MRGDNLKRHMKMHEKKPHSIDEAQTYLCETCGEIKNVDEAATHRSGTCWEMKNVDQACVIVTSSTKCKNINFEKLRRECIAEGVEFNRKIELGRQLKICLLYTSPSPRD